MIDLSDYVSRFQITVALFLIVALLMYIVGKKPVKKSKDSSVSHNIKNHSR